MPEVSRELDGELTPSAQEYPHLLRSHYHSRMEAPGVTRHRRPFYAPLWMTLLAVLVAAGLALTVHRSATTTMVVLVPSGERAPGTIEDPPISAEGEQRAQRLAHMFGEGGIGRLDGVYVSGERRAQQTAAPLLDLLHLTPRAYSPKDASATAAQLLRAHAGGAVLVIGDAAALQQLLAELAGPQVQAVVARDEPDLLYIVSVPTFGRAQVLRLRV